MCQNLIDNKLYIEGGVENSQDIFDPKKDDLVLIHIEDSIWKN